MALFAHKDSLIISCNGETEVMWNTFGEYQFSGLKFMKQSNG